MKPPTSGGPFYAAFWAWMYDNGTGLGSFSTDQCVDRNWPKLVRLRAEIEAYAAQQSGEYQERCEKIMRQLDAVMRRRPQSRVT